MTLKDNNFFKRNEWQPTTGKKRTVSRRRVLIHRKLANEFRRVKEQ